MILLGESETACKQEAERACMRKYAREKQESMQVRSMI